MANPVTDAALLAKLNGGSGPVTPLRCRSFSCFFSVGNRSGCAEGSSTICAKITARAAPKGRRAHQRCR